MSLTTCGAPGCFLITVLLLGHEPGYALVSGSVQIRWYVDILKRVSTFEGFCCFPIFPTFLWNPSPCFPCVSRIIHFFSFKMWKILLSSLAATAFADSFSTVHEKRNPHTGHAWKTRSIPNDAYIPVRIGLTQSNLDEGYDHLMNVAHPSSKVCKSHTGFANQIRVHAAKKLS